MSTIQKLQNQQSRAEKRLLLLQQELRHQLLLTKELELQLLQHQHRLLELKPQPPQPKLPALDWLPEPASTMPTSPLSLE